jgi:D-beta-D-heptose 7-phosphate kinase/D-beta-D-heptose 1-phosphate adenosyltransferase
MLYKHTKSNKGMAGNVYENLRSLRPDWNIDFIHQETVIQKTRYVDETSGYILFRVDENDKASKIDISYIDVVKYDAIVVSDYCKGALETANLERLAAQCQAAKIPMFIDTKKNLGKWSANITFVKINKREYDLLTEFDCQNLIVTLGKDGSMWINKNIVVDTKEVDVRSVVGAGDTFLSAFVVKYLEIKDITESMFYANKAASFATTKSGVVCVTENDISSF